MLISIYVNNVEFKTKYKYKTLEKLLTRKKVDFNIVTVNILKSFNKIWSLVASKLFKIEKRKYNWDDLLWQPMNSHVKVYFVKIHIKGKYNLKI